MTLGATLCQAHYSALLSRVFLGITQGPVRGMFFPVHLVGTDSSLPCVHVGDVSLSGCVWSNPFEPVYLEAGEFCHFRIECESFSWQQPEFLIILSGYGCESTFWVEV